MLFFVDKLRKTNKRKQPPRNFGCKNQRNNELRTW